MNEPTKMSSFIPTLVLSLVVTSFTASSSQAQSKPNHAPTSRPAKVSPQVMPKQNTGGNSNNRQNRQVAPQVAKPNKQTRLPVAIKPQNLPQKNNPNPYVKNKPAQTNYAKVDRENRPLNITKGAENTKLKYNKLGNNEAKIVKLNGKVKLKEQTLYAKNGRDVIQINRTVYTKVKIVNRPYRNGRHEFRYYPRHVRGFVVYPYYPVFYDPYYYAFCYNPYAFNYDWEWELSAGWYGYYGSYLPYRRHFRSVAEWITYRRLAAILAERYEYRLAQENADQLASGSQAAISDEYFEQLVTQDNAELAARGEATPRSISLDEKLLDPKTIYQVVEKIGATEVADPTQACNLNAGDLIQLTGPAPEKSAISFKMIVLSSTSGSCAAGKVLNISYIQLQDMENRANEEITLGSQDALEIDDLKGHIPEPKVQSDQQAQDDNQ